MNIDLQTLVTFADVMDRGSFAAVARDRNIDPSSVSRTVSGLEQRLKVRLFQRTTRRLLPTEAALSFHERIQPILTDLESALQEVRDQSATPQGSLRITTPVAFGQKILAPLLADFRDRFPDLALELILTDAVLDIVAERIDVAVRMGPRPDTGLIGTRLKSTIYRVCASPSWISRYSHASSPEDLSRYSCLRMPLTGHRTHWKFRSTNGMVTEVQVNGDIIISNPLALHQATIDGCGPALLADIFVDEDIAAGRLVDMFPAYEVTATDFDTAAWLLYPSRSYLPARTRAFINFLKEKVTQECC